MELSVGQWKGIRNKDALLDVLAASPGQLAKQKTALFQVLVGADVQTLLHFVKIACNAQERLGEAAGMLGEAVEMLACSFNGAAEVGANSVRQLAWLVAKSAPLRKALDNHCVAEDASFFHLLCSVLLHVEPTEANYASWKELLRSLPNIGLLTLKLGKALDRADAAILDGLKFFALSFIEANEFTEGLGVFLACLTAATRSLPRSDLIDELLVLASESSDLKHLAYLNALIDGAADSVALGIVGFRSILDLLDFIPSSIILEFYTVMIKIALKMSQHSNDQAINELCLIFRKQLASTVEQLCLNGIAGVLAMATCTVQSADAVFDFEAASCSQAARKGNHSASPNLLRELMTLAYGASARFATASQYFYRQLNKAVLEDRVPGHLVEMLSDTLSADFQSHFVAEFQEDIPEGGEIRFNLLDDPELIVYNILPKLAADPVRIGSIAEHLRLLCVVEKKMNNGDLENIDALLSFPVVLAAKSAGYQVCFASHLVALNLFRELVNMFEDQHDRNIQQLCRKRLLHVAELESDLLELIRGHPTYTCFTGGALNLSLLNGPSRPCSVTAPQAVETLQKAAAYVQDKATAASDARASTRLKTEDDLRIHTVPFSTEVLSWLAGGVATDDGKAKLDNALTEEEFLVLLHELRAQFGAAKNCVPLLDILDGTLEAFARLPSRDSELAVQLPRVILDIVPRIKAQGCLTQKRSQAIRRVFAHDGGEASGAALRLKIMLAESEGDEQAIVAELVPYFGEVGDAEIAPLVLQIKGFAVDLRQLYAPLHAKLEASKSVPLLTAMLELCLAELGKSATLDRDQALLQQLENLAQLAKDSYKPSSIEALLKASKDAIEQVIRSVMPRLEHSLLSHKEEVLGILKKFQQYTRTIQTICSHVKSTKDKKLLRWVPPLKRSLESALIRVKQMLEANNCHGAFWMGNLKHKGLDGKEVSAQIPLKREELDADDYGDEEEAEEEEADDGAAEDIEEATLCLSL